MTDDSLTEEQRQLANHKRAVFAEACPGAGKTRAIVARVGRIAADLQPRRGVAVLSFTNCAVEAFLEECSRGGLNVLLRFPSFVGTFDSFVRQFLILPGGIDGVSTCPAVVDSWRSLGIQVRLLGPDRFPGDGVDLDSFDATDNHIILETIGHSGLRAHVLGHQEAYRRAAASYRKNLRRKGYLSAADARVEALRKMQNQHWSAGLGRALAARFDELIVDEAQDCNPLDLHILEWARFHGLPVTMVCDPDQAIYGFRHGSPGDLRDFSTRYDPENRLSLTGNFRSSPPICAMAATLRDRSAPDVAVGPDANVNHPVHILEYQGRTVPAAIGQEFSRLLHVTGIDPKKSVVLAHKRSAALRASGLGLASGPLGTSRVETMAKAIGEFWCPSVAGRVRDDALRTVERMVLSLMGRIEDNELPSRAVERHGIDARWLRRTAFELVAGLPNSCPDTAAGPDHWVATLRAQVKRLELNYKKGTSERRFFPQPKTSVWYKHLSQSNPPGLRCSTIHEAKGRAYEAVCVVIPPDGPQYSYTTQLFHAWKTRTNEEAKRVIYVAVTRSRKLVALAVPAAFRGRLTAILAGAGVKYRLHNLSSGPVCPTSQPLPSTASMENQN